MKNTMNLVIVYCYIVVGRLVSAKFAVKMYKKEMDPETVFKSLPGFLQEDRDAHPQPLPTNPPSMKVALAPYSTLYQGIRSKDDKRVFRKQFDYPPKLKGQRVVCEGLLDCVISHIAIESTEAIPVLLRGGAGYRHFTAIIKAKPYHALKGQVRAYCKKNQIPSVDDKKSHRSGRRFNFGDQLAEENWT